MPKSKLSSLVLCKTILQMLQWSIRSLKSVNISKKIKKTKGWKYCNNCSIIAKFPPSTQAPTINPRYRPSSTPRCPPHSRCPSRLQPLYLRRVRSLFKANRRQWQLKLHISHCCPAISVPIQIPMHKLRRSITKTSPRCQSQLLQWCLRTTQSSARRTISSCQLRAHSRVLARQACCTRPFLESPAPLIVPLGDVLSENGP